MGGKSRKKKSKSGKSSSEPSGSQPDTFEEGVPAESAGNAGTPDAPGSQPVQSGRTMTTPDEPVTLTVTPSLPTDESTVTPAPAPADEPEEADVEFSEDSNLGTRIIEDDIPDDNTVADLTASIESLLSEERDPAPSQLNEPEDADVEAFVNTPSETRVLKNDISDDTVEAKLLAALLGRDSSFEEDPLEDVRRQSTPFVMVSETQWNDMMESGTIKAAEDPPAKEEPTASTTDAPAGPSSLPRRCSDPADTDQDKKRAEEESKRAEEERKRADYLEARLQAAEDKREALEERLKEVRNNYSDLCATHESTRHNRQLDQVKFEDRLEVRNKVEEQLRARVQSLENNLLRANRNRSQPGTETQSQHPHAGHSQLEEELHAARRRENRLVADLETERARSERLETQLMEGLPEIEESFDDQRQANHDKQQRRALLTELKKTQEALKDSQSGLWKARSEVHRLNLNKFDKATEFLDHYNHLFDPHSELYSGLMEAAKYRDGIGRQPTAAQGFELAAFRDYLEERTRVLRDAMVAADPRPILDAFDAEWKTTAEEKDWGAMITYRLSATRAAAALGFPRESEDHPDAFDDMMMHARAAQDRFGDDYNVEVAEQVRDLRDELERRRSSRTHASP